MAEPLLTSVPMLHLHLRMSKVTVILLRIIAGGLGVPSLEGNMTFASTLSSPSSLPTQDLTDAVAKAAKASADNLIHSEGGELRLTESLDLLLPFLLPQGGYSCETLRGVPQGFREFLEPICQKGGRDLGFRQSWIVFYSEHIS